MNDSDEPVRPLLRIVSGNPSPEDLAVLTAVVSAAGGAADAVEPPRRGRWNDPAAVLRRPWHHGPGGWRSALR